MEDTHLRQLEKISQLMALMTLAFLWCYREGIEQHEQKPIPIKKHGRPQHSFFAYGLKNLVRVLTNPYTETIEIKRVIALLSST